MLLSSLQEHDRSHIARIALLESRAEEINWRPENFFDAADWDRFIASFKEDVENNEIEVAVSEMGLLTYLMPERRAELASLVTVERVMEDLTRTIENFLKKYNTDNEIYDIQALGDIARYLFSVRAFYPLQVDDILEQHPQLVRLITISIYDAELMSQKGLTAWKVAGDWSVAQGQLFDVRQFSRDINPVITFLDEHKDEMWWKNEFGHIFLAYVLSIALFSPDELKRFRPHPQHWPAIKSEIVKLIKAEPIDHYRWSLINNLFSIGVLFSNGVSLDNHGVTIHYERQEKNSVSPALPLRKEY